MIKESNILPDSQEQVEVDLDLARMDLARARIQSLFENRRRAHVFYCRDADIDVGYSMERSDY